MDKNNQKKQMAVLIAGTILALVPQYLIRSSYQIYWFFFTKFRTYPGDIWYCWNNYLSKNFPYPREYPGGLRIIFSFIHRFRPPWLNYEYYMAGMSIFLAFFAVYTTIFIYHIAVNTHKENRKIWVFWILAPSFLFYGLLNMDFLSIFTIIAAYYLFIEEDYYLAAVLLGLGTAIKVFPAFLTPLFFFQCPKNRRVGSVLSFIVTWLLFNVPFMVTDWNSWVFPYQWQIEHNFSKTPSDGTYWWIFHQYLNISGKWIGRLSLIAYGGLYYLFLKKHWNLPMARRCAGIIILFLLTDRIYSPQYNMYMLPFLALVDYKIDLKYFYLAEIPNIIQVMFLFFFKENPVYLQTLVFIKYIALVLLFIQLCKAPVVLDTDKEYRKNILEEKSEKNERVQPEPGKA